ncbi:hypothetical protein [Pleionea sp. CnH1-48]|uniref:hypothetical protein n=1 Tax=Pleionea sp. CnH1-48 TaxID=2954494 RepID=UPI0020985831|nr:hypothetical protein [Pleionea sp. CnH1-48]MCO7227123.1 hypothetical protein [Pleionea sp. CnH1-48]
MSILSQFVNMSEPSTIEDITSQYQYEDKVPGGKNDSDYVSCGQNGSYCELQEIYDKHLKSYVEKGEITKQDALNALDFACRKLESPRDREEYYNVLNDKLGVEIF